HVMNNKGQFAFAAELGERDNGIFTGPDIDGHRVIRTGDALDGARVLHVQLSRQGLNNRGWILFQADLSGGRSGLYVAKPRLPAVARDAAHERLAQLERTLEAKQAEPGATDADVLPLLVKYAELAERCADFAKARKARVTILRRKLLTLPDNYNSVT